MEDFLPLTHHIYIAFTAPPVAFCMIGESNTCISSVTGKEMATPFCRGYFRHSRRISQHRLDTWSLGHLSSVFHSIPQWITHSQLPCDSVVSRYQHDQNKCRCDEQIRAPVGWWPRLGEGPVCCVFFTNVCVSEWTFRVQRRFRSGTAGG